MYFIMKILMTDVISIFTSRGPMALVTTQIPDHSAMIQTLCSWYDPYQVS
jgi:hypothetical protein